MTAPFELSVLDAAADIRAGRLSATGLVEACLARIDACEMDVQAWVAVDR
jgi:Asp-tRNA(Asn)/Glu-tRNA(Gln) amidotransferase A subunit family amidase